MLAIKTCFYEGGGSEVGEGPVCVVLHGCCKDYNFEVLSHDFQELISPRSDLQLSLILILLIVVQQSLIQIEDERVRLEWVISQVGCFNEGETIFYLYSQLGWYLYISARANTSTGFIHFTEIFSQAFPNGFLR